MAEKKNNKTDKTDTTKPFVGDSELLRKMRQVSQEVRAEQKEEKKKLFLQMLETPECAGNVSLAAAMSGVSRKYMYELKGEDTDFAKAWDLAVTSGYDTLRDMAMESLYYHLAVKDRTITMFTLRQLDPATWNKDRERVGEGGGPVIVEHKVSPRFAKVMERLLNDNDGKHTATATS